MRQPGPPLIAFNFINLKRGAEKTARWQWGFLMRRTAGGVWCGVSLGLAGYYAERSWGRCDPSL